MIAEDGTDDAVSHSDRDRDGTEALLVLALCKGRCSPESGAKKTRDLTMRVTNTSDVTGVVRHVCFTRAQS